MCSCFKFSNFFFFCFVLYGYNFGFSKIWHIVRYRLLNGKNKKVKRRTIIFFLLLLLWLCCVQITAFHKWWTEFRSESFSIGNDLKFICFYFIRRRFIVAYRYKLNCPSHLQQWPTRYEQYFLAIDLIYVNANPCFWRN